MASSLKPVIAAFLVVSVLLQLACAIHAEATAGSSQLLSKNELDCGGACAARCRLSKRPNVCKRACGTCCVRCGCVPPGTYGQFGACPCYARLKTHGNRPKCP